MVHVHVIPCCNTQVGLNFGTRRVLLPDVVKPANKLPKFAFLCLYRTLYIYLTEYIDAWTFFHQPWTWFIDGGNMRFLCTSLKIEHHTLTILSATEEGNKVDKS